jgi:hypothetical protein
MRTPLQQLTPFEQSLWVGENGEKLIAGFWLSRASSVMRVDPNSLRLRTPDGLLTQPDMFIFPELLWIEAKRKNAWTWHRNSRCWTDGIDFHHYQDYCRVQECTWRPVIVMFLHLSATPDQRDLDAGCEPQCPTGLFGIKVDRPPHHDSCKEEPNGSKSGMVYWESARVKQFATLDDLAELIETAKKNRLQKEQAS